MGDTDALSCEICQNTDGDFPDPIDGPEYCECCEQVLCGPCWASRHMLIMR